MRFLRGLWKVLVGIKDALVLLLLLVFFGALYAMLSATPHAGGPSRGALTLTIDGPIVEQPAAVDPFTVATGGAAPREYRLTELIHALRVASTDPGIEAVALDLDIFAGGRQTALSDLGAEIRRVRAEGAAGEPGAGRHIVEPVARGSRQGATAGPAERLYRGAGRCGRALQRRHG
jgi:protease-4